MRPMLQSSPLAHRPCALFLLEKGSLPRSLSYSYINQAKRSADSELAAGTPNHSSSCLPPMQRLPSLYLSIRSSLSNQDGHHSQSQLCDAGIRNSKSLFSPIQISQFVSFSFLSNLLLFQAVMWRYAECSRPSSCPYPALPLTELFPPSSPSSPLLHSQVVEGLI